MINSIYLMMRKSQKKYLDYTAINKIAYFKTCFSNCKDYKMKVQITRREILSIFGKSDVFLRLKDIVLHL